MLKKNDIFPTADLQYGYSNKHGAWAMLKVIGKEKKGDVVTLWITNPTEIRKATNFRVSDITSVSTRYRLMNGKLVETCNVTARAEAVEIRVDADGTKHTPEDDIAEFFGL